MSLKLQSLHESRTFGGRCPTTQLRASLLDTSLLAAADQQERCEGKLNNEAQTSQRRRSFALRGHSSLDDHSLAILQPVSIEMAGRQSTHTKSEYDFVRGYCVGRPVGMDVPVLFWTANATGDPAAWHSRSSCLPGDPLTAFCDEPIRPSGEDVSLGNKLRRFRCPI